MDFGRVARKAWEAHGVVLADVFDRLTPHQFVFQFCKAETPAADADRVELVRRHNEGRAARGLRPAVPPWLWPGVPSRGA